MRLLPPAARARLVRADGAPLSQPDGSLLRFSRPRKKIARREVRRAVRSMRAAIAPAAEGRGARAQQV